MKLQDFENLLQAAKLKAASTAEMNVYDQPIEVHTTQPFGSAQIVGIDYVPGEFGTGRFVLTVRQLYP